MYIILFLITKYLMAGGAGGGGLEMSLPGPGLELSDRNSDCRAYPAFHMHIV